MQRGLDPSGDCIWGSAFGGVWIPGGGVEWGDPSIGYYGIQSMNRPYASYWNAFLSTMFFS